MPDIFTSHEPKKPEQVHHQPKEHHVQTHEPVHDQRPVPTPQTITSEHLATASSQYPDGGSIGLFSSFRMHPKGVKFVNQEKGEHIILFLRRHFITNVPWILLTILFSLLPIVIIAILQFSNLSLFNLSPQLSIILLLFYYLIIFNYALMHFIIWFYHVGIVTPKRLLDLDVYNILSHHLAETEMADIVDVSFAQNGFFQSFFDFGNVPIQTQAIKANFEFESSPKPAIVSDIITDLRPHRGHTPSNAHQKGRENNNA